MVKTADQEEQNTTPYHISITVLLKSEALHIKFNLPIIPSRMEGHSFLMAPIPQHITVSNNSNHLT